MFNYSDITDQCVKCGKCIPTCTIHQINPDETTSPRGFIHLLGAYEKGNLDLDKQAKDIFESCFLCTNCVDVCPASLPTDLVIENVRADIAQKYGIAWYKKVFFWLLKNRALMDILAKLGFIFKSCGFKQVREKSSMISNFDLPLMRSGRLIPSVKSTSFLNSYPEKLDFGGKRTVGIFIGCMSNYSYTEVGDSLLYILKKLNIDVMIPKEQLCCGAPAYFTGDVETVKYLVKKNIEYFETFIDTLEAILVPEATCSSLMIHDWQRILDDEPSWKERSQKVIKKIFISTKWLYDYTDLKEILKDSPIFDESVTYHDPCHSRKTQGVWREPRSLLSNSFNMIEMSDPNRCCGFGGVTMQTEKFHLAQAAGKPKSQMIKNTNAKFVSAECSACRVQLSNTLHENGVDTLFRHPLELIARSLKAKDNKGEQ